MLPGNTTTFLITDVIKGVMLKQLQFVRFPMKADLVCITVSHYFILTASSLFSFQLCVPCCVLQMVCFVV